MDNLLYIASINILNNKETYDKAYRLISKERRDKVDKLISFKDKKLSILSEILLKKALNDLNLDCNIEYVYNKHNKPYLKNNDIYFNISHSNEYVICVVSENEIGCDLEYIKDINMNIAKKFFNENEYQTIINSNNKLDTFFRIWTLKESFIKNVGLGLNIDLNSFSINIDDNISIFQNINNNSYYFKEIDILNYKCSVCLLNNKDLKINELLDINNI